MNLFVLPPTLPAEELVQPLAGGPGLRVERIVSTGQVSPAGFWYDQTECEWLTVLQGEGVLQLESGEDVRLLAGDTYLLPPHVKHRVIYTSSQPPCIWLAVFTPGPTDS